MALLTPDARCKCVTSIDAKTLERFDANALLIDIDNTIVSREDGKLVYGLEAWITSMKSYGYAICLLSNNWHASVNKWADELEVPIVTHAMKPFPFAFNIARKKLGADRRKTLAIGDQMLTDVLGAHIAGMRALLVEPLSHVDLWYTKIFRRIEKGVLK